MTVREAPKAGETYHYMVTAQDIAEGCRANAYNCPIARAVQRRHGLSGDDLAVSGWVWYSPPGGIKRRLSAPRSGRVSTFIADFDHKRPVKPMRFTLTWEKP